jgi:hypothetical protein
MARQFLRGNSPLTVLMTAMGLDRVSRGRVKRQGRENIRSTIFFSNRGALASMAGDLEFAMPLEYDSPPCTHFLGSPYKPGQPLPRRRVPMAAAATTEVLRVINASPRSVEVFRSGQGRAAACHPQAYTLIPHSSQPGKRSMFRFPRRARPARCAPPRSRATLARA